MFSKNSNIKSTTITQLMSELGSLLYKNDLVIDSRKVVKNSIFCAYPGTKTDGRKFIADAITHGAEFILWEPGLNFQYECANYPVKDLMLYVGLLASYKYASPSLSYSTIGITGTNGKTSISHWLNQAYTLMGNLTGIIGTTGAGIYPDLVYNDSTTPDPLVLQKLMADFVQQKAQVVAMEVSSHALHQGRVNGVAFKTAVFTNLTQDHLDYHGSMEQYYLAKRDLFFWYGLNNVVINADDKYGSRLLGELNSTPHDLAIIDYGLNHGALRATDITIDLNGMTFVLSYKDQCAAVKVKVIGLFNVYNLLAVAGVLILDGYLLGDIAQIMSQFKPVCGRMDALILADKPLVVIDFSHTPDSLEKALTTLGSIEHSGKLYCVFGCGGNRDVKKRPIMGEIASKLSDHVIVTSDNPRFEDPKIIIAQIVSGIKHTNYTIIENRLDAISHALNVAKAGDIVLIAGKGHETYQEIQGVKHTFSDLTIAKNLLQGIE